ncbi:MAG: hypothetical protein J1F39_07505 [Clostridiales bacterium]|nr:hypothetical protein [Clostridiales bacterium]
MEEQSKRFSITYSAATEKEREEIEQIRSRYIEDVPIEYGLPRLRQLDARARRTPAALGITSVVVGMLCFTFGLLMILVWELVPGGISLCLIGGLLVLLSVPIVYLAFRVVGQRYSEKILTLSDELLNGKQTPVEPKQNKTEK